MATAVPSEIIHYENEHNWNYIVAGFWSHCSKNQAYLFASSFYLVVDYVGDNILGDLQFVGDCFRFITSSYMSNYGCDCAFASHEKNKAYLFQMDECVVFDYVIGEMIGESMTIVQMFPFFKGTNFKHGLDGAFESSKPYEVYMFKDDKYVLINYKELTVLEGPTKIDKGFPSLRNTVFGEGIDATFTSHNTDFAGHGYIEAYIFKREYCAMIRFAHGGSKDCLVDGPKRISEQWPNLGAILPLECCSWDGG